MSSKNGSNLTSSLQQDGSRKRSWSIASRLTLLIVLTTFGILSISMIAMFNVLATSIEHQQEDLLKERVLLIRRIIREGQNPTTELIPEVRWQPLQSFAPETYARIYDGKKSLVIESDNLNLPIPSAAFPEPVQPNEDPGMGVRWEGLQGRVFRLVTALERPLRSELPWTIQMAYDISDQENLLVTYRLGIVAILAFGVVLSWVTGLIVSKRALKSVSQITRLAARISATKLHDRIGDHGWPKEMAALAVVLDNMLDRLESSFGQLNRFSADLAHELRTPITNLIGQMEVTLSRARDNEEYRRTLESNLEECGRLSRLVEQMLFLAKADADRATIETRLLDACAQAETVREYYSALAEENGVEVVCRGQGTVLADQVLFRRVLGNLLSNALRHTNRGGKVEIEVSEAGDETQILVKDNGCGIKPEHQLHIFERFYRVDPARAQEDGGTGLGLSIVKSVMEIHQGRVDLKSEHGKGTMVCLHFPLAKIGPFEDAPRSENKDQG